MTRQLKKIIGIAILAVACVCLLLVMPGFAAGLGRAVGVVQQVQGEVFITHDGDVQGVEATRGMRLYKGDTIRTFDDGRLRMRLNDGSIISLASKTKLKLTRSVYQKKKKRRSSFFSMALGKARFFVVKVLDFKRSEFKVKTPTAVCGVRGSDFILEATAVETIATALVDTELEFQSLAFLEEPPVILRDYEESTTGLNQRPTTPVRLPLDRINEKRDQFIDVAPIKGLPTGEDVGGQEGQTDDTGVDEVGDLGTIMDRAGLTRDDFEDDRQIDDFIEEVEPKASAGSGGSDNSDIVDDIKETITEVITGEPVEPELPEFPETP